jgi:hypothetical protein
MKNILIILFIFFTYNIIYSQDSTNYLRPDFIIRFSKSNFLPEKINHNFRELKAYLTSINILNQKDSTECEIQSFNFWYIEKINGEDEVILIRSIDGLITIPMKSCIWKIKPNDKIYISHLIIKDKENIEYLPDLRFIATE